MLGFLSSICRLCLTSLGSAPQFTSPLQFKPPPQRPAPPLPGPSAGGPPFPLHTNLNIKTRKEKSLCTWIWELFQNTHTGRPGYRDCTHICCTCLRHMVYHLHVSCNLVCAEFPIVELLTPWRQRLGDFDAMLAGTAIQSVGPSPVAQELLLGSR